MTNLIEDRLSIGRALVWHLAPGAAVAGAFAGLAYVLRPYDLPPLIPITLAVALVLVPLELGALLYLGRKRNGRWSLRGIVRYRRALTWRQYAAYIPATLVATVVLFVGLGNFDAVVFDAAFAWWPDWMNPDLLALDEAPRPVFLWTVGLTMLFANIIGPTVEELYFRGFLLPRLEHLGNRGILLNCALFALYHFWSPWHVITRTIGVIPLAVGAKRGNVYVAVWAHVLLNTIGFTLSVLALGAS